ncbi:hypothetical protein BDF14DRAFT_1790039 [Spinellus fusiger]|nr:hypothetical protein BDF14DRAFT_1790017 [Spinellus fusiger]KAI7868715.1 hypothetical protein BDF14DRAFT_1790039 [Spinellus fusiger]
MHCSVHTNPQATAAQGAPAARNRHTQTHTAQKTGPLVDEPPQSPTHHCSFWTGPSEAQAPLGCGHPTGIHPQTPLHCVLRLPAAPALQTSLGWT